MVLEVAFYLAWSPTVAEWIRRSETRQVAFRILLLPLVGVVYITEWTYFAVAQVNADLASITAFIAASFLSMLLYIIAPVFAVASLRIGLTSRKCFFPRMEESPLEDEE